MADGKDLTKLPFTPALAAECDDRYNSEQMEREYGKKTVQGFEMAFKAGAEWAHAYFADELRWEPIASKQAKGLVDITGEMIERAAECLCGSTSWKELIALGNTREQTSYRRTARRLLDRAVNNGAGAADYE